MTNRTCTAGAENGSFRKKRGFTMASNIAIRDKHLSLKAKGLYTLIMSYITMPELILTKTFLKAHCTEKERAFNSAWDELKTNGYLKVHFSPAGQSGRWRTEYELLDEPDAADGIHTYYYNLSGAVTATNKTRQEKRITLGEATKTGVGAIDRTPQNVGDGDRTPHNRMNGKRTNGERSIGGVGNNIILSSKTKDNTCDNHSFYPMESERTDDSTDQVIDELTTRQAIPYSYAADTKKMESAIHYLTEWDFRQQHPYTAVGGYVDDAKMNAFNFCVDCLIDMACAKEVRNYRGAQISYAKVIDAINRCADRCAEGGLSEFLEEAIDDFINAYENTEIRDLKRYTMSVIWNCFATYKVKQDAAFAI